LFRDAVSALVNLGFKAAAANVAVQAASAHVGAEATLDEVVRAALQRLR
jgi:Holliday junction DNA helicase RuvA